MKTFSSFFKTLTLILILLATSVSAWGATAELKNGQYVYFDISSNTGWASDNAAMRFNWFWNTNDYCCWNNGTKIDGTNVYYATTQNAYTRGVQMLRMSSNYATQYNYSAMKTVSSRSSDNQNCVKLPTNGWDNCTLTWGTYVPPMNNVTIANNGTTITSGSGTQVDPYIIAGGATVKVKATADLKVPDPSPSIRYKFSNDGGSSYNTESTTNTYTFTAAAYSTSAKTYTVMVSSRAAISTTYNTAKPSSKIYFKVPAQYTVTFNANGHGTAPSSQKVLHGAKAQEPTAPTAAGYTFGGWYKESGCTNKYDFNTAVTGNLILYAKWTQNTYSYTVTAGEGGTVSPASGTVAQGSGVTIEATPNDGYEFVEWTATNGTLADASSASTTFTPSANNANATASFKVAGCTQTPTTPTSLTAKVGGNELVGDVCSGTDVILTAGGTISVGSLQWGTGTVGENIIDAENGRPSITVSPTVTTTYWVRSIITEAGVCYGATSSAKTLQINITPALVQPVLSKSTLTLEEGGSTGSITVTSGTTGGTWTSSDPDVATVNNGTVTPKGPGTATITYTVSNGCEDDKTATCDVTVTAKPYYIAGRLQQNWNTSSKTQQFTYVSNGQYKYETGKTVAELSAQWKDNNYTAAQYFFIHTGSGLSNSFTSSNSNGHNFHQKLGYENALALSSNSENLEAKYIKFADTNDNSSNVVIWWEPSTNKLWYTATANLTTNLYLLGLGSSNWTVNNSRRFVKDENDPTKAKVTITLAKGEYTKGTNNGFKINDNVANKWYGNDGTMKRNSCTGWTFEEGKDNAGLTADVAGDYVFTLDLTTMKLTVTYPTAYTLTYGSGAGGSGTVTANNSIKSGDLVLAGTSVTLTATPASGYDFAAWYSDQACEGAAISSNNPYNFSINSNTTLYAKWKAQSFTLTWELDGGRITEEGTPAGPVAVGTTLVAPTVEKDYYDFASWAPTEPTTMPADNATYTAQWTPKKYAITYKDQGDEAFSGTHANDYPTTHTYKTTTTLLGATKSGYTFAGWYSDSECAGERVETLGEDVTEAITLYAKWEVASYTITFDQQSGSDGTPSVTAQFGAKLSAITIPSRDGYLFDGYYTQTDGKGTKYYNADGTTDKNMPHNISTLYAKWIGYDHCIFFKNTLGTLGWKDIYVYTFSADTWDSYVGVKVKNKYIEYGKMTQIGKTDIFYYVLTDLTGFNYIAFSNAAMNNYDEFYGNNAIYRGDRSDQLQLFIPNATGSTKTVNQTKYYNDGIWMKYNSKDSGYDWSGKTAESDWSDHSLLAEKKGDYSFTTTVSLKAGTNYEFKISNVGKDANNEKIKETAWYGWNGTMTQASCTNKHFKHNTSNNAMITPTVDGDYTFTVYLGDGKVMVSLEYPLSTDDYRLAYNDITLSKIHEGHYLKKRTTGEILDTVSFFVRKDKTPQILLQQCTKIVDGKPTWATVNNGIYAITINADGVYNFVLKQTNSGTHTATLETSATHKYKGDYYIRTDASEGGWKSYRQASNRMNYSTYADSHSEFNHYFCSYRERGCNVKFIVANDYSECLTDTMDNDDIIRPNQSSVGCLPANANIRFGWDSETNQLSRAYISGAGLVQDRFLVLMGNEYLKDAKGNTLIAGTNGSPRYGLKANEEIFADKGNWIYQVDVQACNQTTIRLSALYNGEEQLFKGARNDISLLNSTEPKYYKVRMIYDFKTNHMISAWLLDEQGNTIEGEGSLASDILVIRKNQDQANQLTFIGAAERTDVGVVYGVMTFDKFFLNNIDKEGNAVAQKDEKTIFERALYWISFPFNVKLKDIFGFSNYGDHWILEEYNGEARAENGAWVDSESYWEYITDSEYELEAGKGYVLCLDLDKMGVNSDVFQHTDEVSLYFPSKEKVGTINGATTSITLQPYTCNIERDNRNIYDSNWHLIGVPRFADITTENINIIPQPTQGDVGFYYEYGSNGEYTVKKSGATTFQTMSAYLVQYAGVINWTSTGITVPAAIAARKNSPAEPEQVHLRLEIAQDDEMADQTFVQLQQEGATAEFDMNLDLTKMLHSGTNIYTLAGEQGIKSAGNVMPMSECVVPVGVKIDAEGEYTFRMPDGTEGMVVELIDYERDITTNLLLFDYTVTLPAGSNESRFALHIQPNKSGVTTGIEGAYPQPLPEGKGTKFLIDGKLMIRTAEGVIYDAQGHVVQ